MIQGAKAVYDFTVYVSTEVGKHRHSLYLSLSDIWRKKLEPLVKRMIPLLHKLLRLFVMILFIRFLYIMVNYVVRTRYQIDLYIVIVSLMNEFGVNQGVVNLQQWINELSSKNSGLGGEL